MCICVHHIYICIYIGVSHVALVLKKKKNLTTDAGDIRDAASISGLGRSLEEEMQPSPVFLPGKFHGHRRLAGYSP